MGLLPPPPLPPRHSELDAELGCHRPSPVQHNGLPAVRKQTGVIGFLPPCCEDKGDMEKRKNILTRKKRMETEQHLPNFIKKRKKEKKNVFSGLLHGLENFLTKNLKGKKKTETKNPKQTDKNK